MGTTQHTTLFANTTLNVRLKEPCISVARDGSTPHGGRLNTRQLDTVELGVEHGVELVVEFAEGVDVVPELAVDRL